MIISASRRTDIPALYSNWFIDRIKAGEVLVRNPRFPRRISRISLKPEDVDCIVFWTKNPGPIIKKFGRLTKYKLLFHITITPYGKGLEPGLPEKDVIMEDFMRISRILGKDHLIWRYDPILISPEYSIDFHIDSFRRMIEKLSCFTDSCVVSFLDEYKSISAEIERLNVRRPDQDERALILERFYGISKAAGIKLSTCCEPDDYSYFGVNNIGCINANQIEKITGYSIRKIKDRGQRKFCECVKSVDIGSYGTCTNGCVYCYAGRKTLDTASSLSYDPESPMLCDLPREDDEIIPGKIESLKLEQRTLDL